MTLIPGRLEVKKSEHTPPAAVQGKTFVAFGDLWLLTAYFVKPGQRNVDGSVTGYHSPLLLHSRSRCEPLQT